MAYTKSSDFAHISNVFINEYMPAADGNFVKVYLLAQSCCGSSRQLTDAQIAEKLGISEAEVKNAWIYWQSRGVVVLNPTDSDFDVEFVELKSLPTHQRADIEAKPVYTPDEVYTQVASNQTLQEMYKTVGRILDKPLSTNDITVIYGFYDYYRLPTDVIPMIVSYAVSNGKRSMRYIDKLAQSWADMEIDSFDKASKYLEKLEKYNSRLSRIMRAMGIYGRTLTKTEGEYMSKWIDTYAMPDDVITYAYDITVSNTGRLNVRYMDKILTEWYQSGIKTAHAASQHRENFRQKSSAKPAAKKTTGFDNFSQQPTSRSMLEAMGFTKNKGTDA